MTDSLAQRARAQTTRYVVNGQFNQAVLFFADGSHLQFEHTTIDNRWARASAPGSAADRICRSLRLFRLNALHLHLTFEDGSDVEFFAHSAGLGSGG